MLYLPVTETIRYHYDFNGNRTATVLPDGRQINCLYYGSGHLHQISLDDEVITDIERDKLHREIFRTQGKLAGRYELDPLGRLKRQIAALNKLTEGGKGKNKVATGYGQTAVKRSFGYDRTGNLVHRELADGEVQNYFYDLHDQPVKAEIFKKDGTKETWAYTYDALGRRIGKGRLKEDGGLEEETRFVWDGSHLLQEVHSDGRYTYIYTDPDSYEPLAQVRNWTTEEGESKQETRYFHCDQIGIPREMTDKDGNLVWFGDYYGWGKLKSETNVTGTAHQPFRLQNQYADRETGLHYNFFRYYEPDAGRFVNQDPIGLSGGDNLYQFAPNTNKWLDVLGLNKNLPTPYWPPNRGALGEVRSITLPVGTLVDRYGYPGGTFVSPVGTPYPMRALPPGSNQKPYTIYRVLKPIDNVAASKIMPWFREIGLGTQYELPKPVKSYIKSGHLEEVEIGKC